MSSSNYGQTCPSQTTHAVLYPTSLSSTSASKVLRLNKDSIAWTLVVPNLVRRQVLWLDLELIYSADDLEESAILGMTALEKRGRTVVTLL
jgi:hypothetical protein